MGTCCCGVLEDACLLPINVSLQPTLPLGVGTPSAMFMDALPGAQFSCDDSNVVTSICRGRGLADHLGAQVPEDLKVPHWQLHLTPWTVPSQGGKEVEWVC